MVLSMEERREWLGRVPLFHGCTPDSLMRVAQVTGELDFAAGQVIVAQGQVGNGLYIIVDGRAVATSGQERLAEFGPGDFFGELTVIDQEPRSATVVAEGACRCLALASWDLLDLLRGDPQLALNLLTELSHRLRAAVEQLRH